MNRMASAQNPNALQSHCVALHAACAEGQPGHHTDACIHFNMVTGIFLFKKIDWFVNVKFILFSTFENNRSRDSLACEYAPVEGLSLWGHRKNLTSSDELRGQLFLQTFSLTYIYH